MSPMTQAEIDKIIAMQADNIKIAWKHRWVEHLSYKQIAQRMGVSENAVRLMLSKKKT